MVNGAPPANFETSHPSLGERSRRLRHANRNASARPEKRWRLRRSSCLGIETRAIIEAETRNVPASKMKANASFGVCIEWANGIEWLRCCPTMRRPLNSAAANGSDPYED